MKVEIDLNKIDECMLRKIILNEFMLAERDYIRKKELRGEVVDIDKMRNAICQRRKIKLLSKLHLAKIFHQNSFILPAMRNISSEFLEEVESDINKSIREVRG